MQAAVLALCACIGAASAATSPLADWNLIVRGSVTSSSEVDGSALIGGSLSGTSNYAVQGVTEPSGLGLAVAGNIASGNIQVNNAGNAAVAGSINATLNLNGGSQVGGAGVPAMVADIFDQLEASSAYFTSLPANGTLSNSGHFSASPQVIAGQLVAVYSISADDFQNFGQLTLAIGAADSVIINVAANGAGVVDFTAPPNILSDFTQANSSKILWNFYDATILEINNSFSGAVLAPNADLRLRGGGINGSVAVNSVSVQDPEVRLNLYQGLIGEPIPTPASLALMGVGGLVAMRRRR